MKPRITPEVKEVMEAVHYRPSVSVVLPFEPMATAKKLLVSQLEEVINKVTKKLRETYPGEMVDLICHKIRRLTASINFSTSKRSIILFVSPVFEKLLYLDISVQERILIDESFEIRDLVYSKTQLHKYLVLLLGSKQAGIYLGNTDNFVKILPDFSVFDTPSEGHHSDRPGIYTDLKARKETDLNKFLRRIDDALGIVYNAYHLPLFVVGDERVCGHFKQLSRHKLLVQEYLHGHFEKAGSTELKALLKPAVDDWKKVIQQACLNKLNEARSRGKLAIGIEAVWEAATNKNGRLLVIEKNYSCAVEQGGQPGMIRRVKPGEQTFAGIGDAVDDVIEKVLENGGDVEFVEEGALHEYQSVALILYS